MSMISFICDLSHGPYFLKDGNLLDQGNINDDVENEVTFEKMKTSIVHIIICKMY